jgi:hypothetical protein
MADISQNPPPDNTESFREVCQRQAELFRLNRRTLQDCVDFCWRHAESRGLDHIIGTDGVQQIISAAFAAVREDL